MNPAGNPPDVSPLPAATRSQSVRVVATRLSCARACLHWAEFGMEAALRGLFMVSACAFTALIGLWIYFPAPLLGMLSAAELYLRLRRGTSICTKLHHPNHQPCIFRCGYKQAITSSASAGG